MYLKITTWLLLLTWLYSCFSVCTSHKRHKHSAGLKHHVEPDDDDFVEDLRKKSNITRHDSENKKGVEGRDKKDNIKHVPKELNWDWGAFNVKSKVNEEDDYASSSKKDRKTIIPLEGIVFAKVKDNHVFKPKLTSRTTKMIHPKRRLKALSRRFDLYPRWFSNSIPTLFGKHFARRYYKPYGSLEEANPQTRHHIIRSREKAHRRAGTVFHELPLSWMAASDSRNAIPKKHEDGELDPSEEAGKIEGIDSTRDDNLIIDQSAADGAEHSEKKTLPFLKDIPHEVMAELNPYEYTVLPGDLANLKDITLHSPGNSRIIQVGDLPNLKPLALHSQGHSRTIQGARRAAHPHPSSHHHAHNVALPETVPRSANVIGHLATRTNAEETPDPTVQQEWTAYNPISAHQHHQHKPNPCIHNPCLNRGHCHFNGGNFKCVCRPGFSGDICDRTRFSCHPNPCYNGGTCTKLQNGYFCTCLPGFRGAECEAENPCRSNPCENDGKCTDTADGFFCTCGNGFSGKTCEGSIHLPDLSIQNTNPYAQATGLHDRSLAQHVASEHRAIEQQMEGMILHDKLRNIPVVNPDQKFIAASVHEPVHDTTLHDVGLHNTLLHDRSTRGDNLFHTVEPTLLQGTGERRFEAGVTAVEHVVAGAPTLHEIDGATSKVEDLPLAETSECQPSTCLNGGTCEKTTTGAVCNCAPGHFGVKCEDHITEPVAKELNVLPVHEASDVAVIQAEHVSVACPLPCKNGGSCAKSTVGLICQCPANYRGNTCEDQITEPVAKELNAVPVHEASDVAVIQAEHVSVPCPLPCKNGGSCAKSAAGFICKCPANYHGDTCEERLSTIDGVNPALSGTGSTTAAVPLEVAEAGSTTIPTLQQVLAGSGAALPAMSQVVTRPVNQNEDTRGTSESLPVIQCQIPCHNGGTCTRTDTGNTCSCPAGFTGSTCEGTVAPDDTQQPTTESISTPDPNANGVALSPCAIGACKNGGTCIKTATGTAVGHICSCPVGFHGADCGSPDLCLPNPCENGGSCVQEGDENYKCVCQSGFKGLDCNLPNHCTKNPCNNNGVCEETPDSFRCKCGLGFKGRDCAIASPCQLNPCLHKGACLEKGSTFACNCHPGYKGSTCQSKDPCYPNPCSNGVCHEDLGIAQCNCSHGWIGNHCDMTDFCANSPCSNGGTCVHDGNSFKCLCPPTFRGITCENQDACHSNPCENNGRCDQGGGTFMCSCPPGYHGERCHLKAHCQPSPCNGHGECFESDEGFICECKPRYMGKYCEITRYCVDNPCVNGGHCIEGDSTYHCDCPFGYKSKTCSVNVCDSHPCLNGGTCIPAANEDGYGCECVFPYHGVTCGEMDPCLTNPCRNGGICQSQLQGLHDASIHHGLSVFGPIYSFKEKDKSPADLYDTDKDHHEDDNGKDHRPFMDEDTQKDHRPDDSENSFDDQKEQKSNNDKYHKFNNGIDQSFDTGNDQRSDNEKDHRVDNDKYQRFDNDMNGESLDTTKDISKGHMDKDKDINFEEKNSNPDKVGSSDTDKDGHLYNENDSRPSRDDTGHFDNGKDSFRGHLDSGKDSSRDYPKTDWPIEAKNDHPGLLEKEDYISNHVPEHLPEPQADGGAPEPKLPQCPCAALPQPCTWPPLCQPQACTPPCRRQYDRHNHRFHTFGDYKKSSIRSPHNYSQVVFFTRKPAKTDVHKVEKRDLEKTIFETRYLGKGYTATSKRIKVVKRDIQLTPSDYTQLSVKEILALKRNVIISAQASKRLEIIPKVMINYRHPGETNVYKRTMHELYVCQCMPGYLGAHCQHMNPCRETPCTNGGTCIPRGDHYICQCLSGFGGRHCDDPHPCAPNPCTHNGKCHLAKSVRGYECKCKHGWRGYNCDDRDNCAITNPCKHDGNCINIDGADGGIECKCRTRFSGKHCEIDACAACDQNAYCHHGNCVCENGYFGNGFRCKAMSDICTPNPCDNKGECRPGIDGKLFSCECQPGYVGTRCELPHPCANNPCLHNGACVDESNSKDRGILLLDRNDYKCFCSAGYKGKNCGETSLAACSSGPCQNNGTCFDASSESHSKRLSRTEEYECFCDLGYTGKNCEINHYACYSFPCMNGGTCLDAESLPDINFDAHGYKCNCNHGFTGRNCEVTVYGPGPCHQSPCLNNGRCVDAMNSNDPDMHFDYEHQFKCVCPPQYSGKICEIPYPACFSRPCHNKGLCSDKSKEPNGLFDETGYTCTCLAGYDGKNCERQNSLAIQEDTESSQSHDYSNEAKVEGKSDEDLRDDTKTEGKKDDEYNSSPRKEDRTEDEDDAEEPSRNTQSSKNADDADQPARNKQNLKNAVQTQTSQKKINRVKVPVNPRGSPNKIGHRLFPEYAMAKLLKSKPHIKESQDDYPASHLDGSKIHLPFDASQD